MIILSPEQQKTVAFYRWFQDRFGDSPIIFNLAENVCPYFNEGALIICRVDIHGGLKVQAIRKKKD